MKKAITAALAAFALGGAMLAGGCTQMPTEKQSISDLRPMISFKPGSDRVGAARVFVDGLDLGAVADYVEGSAAVRILPGTHVLRVVLGTELVLEEKFYLGDGVNRAFIVK
jgi:hypothetical protein